MLPDDAEAADLLDRLGVDPIDRAATLAARPDPVTHPELWWVLDRAYHRMLAAMGVPPTGGGWPALPAAAGPIGRHLFVWVSLAVLSHVRRYHAAQAVPDDVSWASLGFLGSEMTSFRAVTGLSGLGATWGMRRTFGGVNYRLGRLAFDRQQPAPDLSQHPALEPGQSGLNTHIPAGRRLDPDACDDSFAQARDFFPGRFPEQPAAFGCHSWLMDDQLTRYLPDRSHILAFQRRFTNFHDTDGADWAPLEHVFHRRYDGAHVPDGLLNGLPQDTTLQRAIVTHLRSGGHWYSRTGWFPL